MACKIKCPIEYCNYEPDFSWYHNIIVSKMVEHYQEYHNLKNVSFELARLQEQLHNKDCKRQQELEET